MEQEGGGDEGEDDGGDFSSQIWNMVKAWLLLCQSPVNHSCRETRPRVKAQHGCAMWAISDNWLPLSIF